MGWSRGKIPLEYPFSEGWVVPPGGFFPCAIQYCYAHLLREVQDLEKEFPDSAEVQAFVSTLAPLLSLAMGLRNQPLSASRFRSKAFKVKAQIISAVDRPARHLGIRHIQEIFRQNANRL